MGIAWDIAKERRLLAERGISLAEIADLLMAGKYLAILEHPSRPSQMLFVMQYRGYTHVVPFVTDAEGTIVLKTAFPSRKFHKLYGENNEDKAK